MKKHPYLLLILLMAQAPHIMAQAKKSKKMPDITLPGPLGNQVSVSDLKGKVVLVDFWASWCQPCRNNNPNLVEIHDKYKEQGFEIFSVSIDKDKTAWMAAITDDKLFWPQVIDTEGWQSVVLSKFNIDYIPTNMLVDKNGFIRGYDLAKEDLDKLIPGLLKE